MNINTTFAERLKKYRTDKNWTQEQLYEKSGIAINTIRSYEQGKGNPTLASIDALSKALGVTISQLCGEELPEKTIKIETYADLLRVLSQMNELDLDCGTFSNGEPVCAGFAHIECDKHIEHSPYDDLSEEYLTTITFTDETLYTFFSTYKKMLEMIASENDELGKTTLISMKNAWVENQIRSRKDDWIIVPF